MLRRMLDLSYRERNVNFLAGETQRAVIVNGHASQVIMVRPYHIPRHGKLPKTMLLVAEEDRVNHERTRSGIDRPVTDIVAQRRRRQKLWGNHHSRGVYRSTPNDAADVTGIGLAKQIYCATFLNQRQEINDRIYICTKPHSQLSLSSLLDRKIEY